MNSLSDDVAYFENELLKTKRALIALAEIKDVVSAKNFKKTEANLIERFLNNSAMLAKIKLELTSETPSQTPPDPER